MDPLGTASENAVAEQAVKYDDNVPGVPLLCIEQKLFALPVYSQCVEGGGRWVQCGVGGYKCVEDVSSDVLRAKGCVYVRDVAGRGLERDRREDSPG